MTVYEKFQLEAPWWLYPLFLFIAQIVWVFDPQSRVYGDFENLLDVIMSEAGANMRAMGYNNQW